VFRRFVATWFSDKLKQTVNTVHTYFLQQANGQMSTYEIASTILAIFAIIVSLLALNAAKKANQIAKAANLLATAANQLAKDANQLATDANQLATDANGLATDANRLATFANQLAKDANKLATTANQVAKDANALTERNAWADQERFKKANTFSMYMAVSSWPGINMTSPVGPDVIKVANLMDQVATIWMEKSVDKKTILESAWPPYKTAYEQFDGVQIVVPGHAQSGRNFNSLLSPKIREAYEQMKLGNVHI
jgi:uncharacterized protein YoxC